MKPTKVNIGSLSGVNKLAFSPVVTPFTKEDNRDIKDVKPKEVTGPVSYQKMLEDADCYESYLDTIETYCIIKNLSPKKYKKAVQKIRKMIKYLREGKGDKVYNTERYNEIMRRREGDDC